MKIAETLETMTTTAEPVDLSRHPMWSPSDFVYLRGKGYSNDEILAFWERDRRLGKTPLHWKESSAKLQASRQYLAQQARG